MAEVKSQWGDVEVRLACIDRQSQELTVENRSEERVNVSIFIRELRGCYIPDATTLEGPLRPGQRTRMVIFRSAARSTVDYDVFLSTSTETRPLSAHQELPWPDRG